MKHGPFRLGGAEVVTRAVEGRAVIIDRLPPIVQGFFSGSRAGLSKPQYRHLWSVVLGFVVTLRAAKVCHLSAAAPRQGHRTSTGAFLSHSEWDAPALVDRASMGLLAA